MLTKSYDLQLVQSTMSAKIFNPQAQPAFFYASISREQQKSEKHLHKPVYKPDSYLQDFTMLITCSQIHLLISPLIIIYHQVRSETNLDYFTRAVVSILGEKRQETNIIVSFFLNDRPANISGYCIVIMNTMIKTDSDIF